MKYKNIYNLEMIFMIMMSIKLKDSLWKKWSFLFHY